MSKYAFLIHGEQSAYEELTPKIRLRKLNTWLLAEKIQQDKASKHQARQMLAAVQLAKRISAEKQISVEDAFSLLQNQGEAESAILLSDFQAETEQLMDRGMSRDEQNSKIITIFMRTRAEGLKNRNWERLGDWSESDTEMLGEVLVEKILTFILDEQRGGLSEDEDENFDPPTIDEVEVGNEEESGTGSSESASKSSKKKKTGTPSTPESSPVESPVPSSDMTDSASSPFAQSA
jgi:hypothetical protein